ncbi:MAG TPA: hypothetical protein VE954_14880 [Oligoflexus sp.]|uniref:hypothetical protein n=1 Tax=Oligoflexus sp. TaxID=1971216 RepID=UPI002D418DAD|nr:hypothetical protein [Oligoflexus sp.]HYX34386.1 hypothetical protein [Oligoflexus sp.]
MNMKLLALSLLVSSSAFGFTYPYEMISVPHKDVIEHMIVGSDDTNTPENLQGLWWMDGNPLPDEVVSFAGTKWEEVVEDGELVGYVGTLPVYDQAVWTWHDSPEGRAVYKAVLKAKLVYKARFNKDFTSGVVTPTIQPGHKLFEIMPSKLLEFRMEQVGENEFARDSTIATLESSYRFRRIVDGKGNKLDTVFEEFLQKAEADNAWLPICPLEEQKFDAEGKLIINLPTACVK